MTDKSEEPSDPGKRMRDSITYPGTIKKIGNTFHVIVPKDYVVKAGWGDGDDVDVTITLIQKKGEGHNKE